MKINKSSILANLVLAGIFTVSAISSAASQNKSFNNVKKQLVASQIDNLAKSGTEVNEISNKTTLLFIITDEKQNIKGNGSGSIIAKQGNSCLGVTNRHVVLEEDGKLSNLVVRTYDDKLHKPEKVQWFNSEDLALVWFKCAQNYEPVTLATYQLSPGQPVYLSGWPPSLAAGAVSRQFTSGSISTILEQPLDGYRVGYTNVTQGGMSGGQVLDSAGRLVAIHGVGGIKPTTGEKTGFNYGIPVTTLLARLSENGINYPYQVTYSTPQESPNVNVVQSNEVPTQQEQVTVGDIRGEIDETLKTIDYGRRVVCGLFGC